MNAGHPAPGSPIGSPIGYWKFDEMRNNTCTDGTSDICDQSVNQNDAVIAVAGGADQLWRFAGKVNGTSLCNGTSCSADVGGAATDVELFDINDTDDRTFTGWFNRTADFNSDHALFSKRADRTSAGWSIYIDGTSDKLVFEIDDGTDEYEMASTTTFTASGWHYFAIIWDQDSGGSGGNSKIYIDGNDDNESHSGTIGDIGSANNGEDTTFFVNSGNIADFNGGMLDEMKVYGSTLTRSQIIADYNFASSASFGNVADHDEEGNSLSDPLIELYFEDPDGQNVFAHSEDASMECYLGTTSGSESQDPTRVNVAEGPRNSNGLGGKALKYSGAQEVDCSNEIDFGDSQDFTISAWFNIGSDVTSDQVIVGKGAGPGGAGAHYNLYFEGSGSDDIRFEVDDGTDQYITHSNTTFSANSGWHHVVAVWDDNSDTLTTIYIDGQADEEGNSGILVNVNSPSNSNNFQVGAAHNTTDEFNGHNRWGHCLRLCCDHCPSRLAI